MSRKQIQPRLNEFERIARYFAPLAGKGARGLTDDVALIPGPARTEYVLKTDSIVENIHFFADDPPAQIAQKLLRVNLSDLAAKGARPIGYLLAIALPITRDEAWLEGFSQGLAEDQKRFGITLLGGDSDRTDGPVTLTVTAIGKVKAGTAPRRSGAHAGDRIYVSGTLGDAALGLLLLKQDRHVSPSPPHLGGEGHAWRGLTSRHAAFLVDRYRLPQPRLELGRKLIGLASAAMDISDGLVADLGHICEASKVGAVIEAARLPLSAAARTALRADPNLLETILAGGDDYEILFTAPASAARRLARLPVTEIGRIEKGKGVRVSDAEGKPVPLSKAGYTHF